MITHKLSFKKSWHCRKDNVFPYGKRTWLLVRSVVGIINSAAIYFAVKHMPIGDMTMIAASSTIFVCVYGKIFLSEPIQKINVFNIALVLIGILLITKPRFIFGNDDDSVYETDELALYAVGTLTALSIFIFPNISIALRALKGIYVGSKDIICIKISAQWINLIYTAIVIFRSPLVCHFIRF